MEEIELDPNAPEFLANRFEELARLRRECPVAWNKTHDGFWMVTGYEGVQAVARDNETFAHKFEPGAPDGIDYWGIVGIPRAPERPKVGIAETDGPEHHELRRALNPWFAPQVVERSLPLMHEVATWFLDQWVERGEMDLVLDYTTPVPAVLTLQMMGLPCGQWEHFAEFFHATSLHPQGSPEHDAAMARIPEMRAELLGHAEARRADPHDDLTSFLVGLQLNGRSLSDEEIGNIMFNLVAGGLDTTTSLTSWALYHLGMQPEKRQRLVEEPSLLPTAIEEFLRYVSPNETLSRTASRDADLCGHRVKAGDRVLISWLSANHDESVFPDADQIVIDRADNRHLAFGLGGHRCIGSHVARAQARVIIGEVLRRIPDYVVDVDRFEPYPDSPLMTGVGKMPVTFTPAAREGDGTQPF
jgi:cytochrome P450